MLDLNVMGSMGQWHSTKCAIACASNSIEKEKTKQVQKGNKLGSYNNNDNKESNHLPTLLTNHRIEISSRGRKSRPYITANSETGIIHLKTKIHFSECVTDFCSVCLPLMSFISVHIIVPGTHNSNNHDNP